MTEDQRKKYEEAAKDHTRTHLSVHSSISAMQGESFFMGCEFASQDTEERMKKLQDENKRLREALKALMTNPSIDLGDMIYNVKDREGKGWEGPDVTAWGKAVEDARKLLNL